MLSHTIRSSSYFAISSATAVGVWSNFTKQGLDQNSRWTPRRELLFYVCSELIRLELYGVNMIQLPKFVRGDFFLITIPDERSHPVEEQSRDE